MLKAVFDTNIFLRALINPHSYCGRLVNELAVEYELILSPAIVHEILEVLHRPKLRVKLPQITQLDIARLIALFEQAQVIEPLDILAISRDPKDDKFLACALAAEADYLVTEDKDLLVLHPYQQIQICQPVEFIRLLEARQG
ncbi:MAG: putative toxin-antitoxin system toxin component, PIN family [Anaerolineae bacterium]